ncbi:DUF4181 domain-containing protein [Thalassobacillus hwangdonensis]|uniref:DUF4181 domain-containing protein n=1 Tax=Thalassobacillus hwangdonensis TaxID=546108 RepID=A0ABW3L2C5_9BACI
MEIGDIISFAVIVLIVYLGFYYGLKLKLGIKEEIPYKHVNKKHKWTEMIVVFGGIAAVITVTVIDPYMIHPTRYQFLMVILFMFRGWMEWKHKREAKRHYLSLLTSLTLIIVIVGVEIISPWL